MKAPPQHRGRRTLCHDTGREQQILTVAGHMTRSAQVLYCYISMYY